MNTRIKELSRQKNISYVKIAKQLNVTPRTITNWTTGKRSMTIAALNEVSESLGCQVHELLECGVNYTQAYSPEGEWLGIIKK